MVNDVEMTENKNREPLEDFRPREYQVEILEQALKENVIVYLPTGSGKTFIATMLIKYLSESIQKKYSEGGKRSFFLVNTVPLVAQQAASIRRQLPFEVGEYTGDMGVDYWDQQIWLDQLEQKQILVMTAQIFLDMLLHKYLQLSDVNVLVMDECHHAVNQHAMRQIMQQFENIPFEARPRVLGLTATLLNANCKPGKVEEEVHTLEITLQSKIVTAVNDDMVRLFSTDPVERIEYYDENLASAGTIYVDTCVQSLNSILSSVKVTTDEVDNMSGLVNEAKKNYPKKIRNAINAIKDVCDNLGLFAANMAALAKIVLFERLKHSCSDVLTIKLFSIVTTKLHFLRKQIQMILDTEEEKVQPIVFASPKMKRLIEMLKGFRANDLAIVFVEKRITAKVLYYVFKELEKKNENFSGIRSDFIVGFNSNPFNDTRESLFEKKVNLQVLRRFNTRSVNVLFASNVIEEGLDVKLCNYVIKFDEPKTFRSYIQSKGRARDPRSQYVLFVQRYANKFITNYDSFKNIEESLKNKLCSGRCHDREGGTDREAQKKLYDYEFPPYCVGNDPFGAKVTLYSAISLLNRYCSILPQDKFSCLTPLWSITGEVGKYSAQLQLPINSPIKHLIIGPVCKNKFTAKRAVALKACELLHKEGELDDQLLPVGSNSRLLDDENIYPNWDYYDDDTKHVPGTKKNRRVYNKQYANWLCECRPQAGRTLYLHVISTTPNYSRPDNMRQLAFYNLIKSNRFFSILTTNRWPKVCQFPLFMNIGEILIELKVNFKTLELNEEQIYSLVEFHSLLFTDVLNLVKKFIVRDYDNKENSYLVVPTMSDDNGFVDIDWATVDNEKSIPKVTIVPTESRQGNDVTDKTYGGKIVVPWYRPLGQNMRYVVTRVCRELSPESAFPHDAYTSYANYFKLRYSQRIVHMDQPLIEVRAISNKLNCLLPRGKGRHGPGRRRKDEEDFEETLVPELCSLLSFPAVYMLKATLLPSLLHRIECLLNAEQLRRTISIETGVGVLELDERADWDALKIDKSSLCEEDPDAVHSTIEISDMLDNRIQSISTESYPWGKEQEPVDVERELNVDLVSIYHYQKFISKPVMQDNLNNVSVMEPTVDRNVVIADVYPHQPLDVLSKTPECSIGPQQCEMLQVLTSASANDIINYERLETLGDSFLKFAVSLSLFINYDGIDEGKLTHIKGKIIGNRNLFYCGRKINLGSLLKVYDCLPGEWNIPGFGLLRSVQSIIKDTKISCSVLHQITVSKEERDSGQLSPETQEKLFDILLNSEECDENLQTNLSIIDQQSIADKTIADSVEALIGAYLKCCGVSGALKIVNWLGVLPDYLSDVDSLLYERPPPALLVDAPRLSVDVFLVRPDLLEEKLGYTFTDRSYLLQALSHSSYSHRVTDCYQRLEFLGDAILDFLITAHIFETCGNLSPGDLTDLRSALVNNVTFACLTVRYGFHKHMLAKVCKLNELVNKFVQHQENRNHAIGSEVLFLIEEKDMQVAECIDVPKVLGDLFESLAAAVYLDSNKSLPTVWRVFYRLMAQEISKFSKNVPRNHIRLLHEKFPSPSAPKFGKTELLEEDFRGMVLIPLEINHNNESKIFHGVGENKYQAKLAAAKLALRYYHTPKVKEQQQQQPQPQTQPQDNQLSVAESGL